jgi:hypothetical protein
VQYKDIRYTLRTGITPSRWVVVIHPPGAEPIEKPFEGSRESANLKARTMINAWLKSRAAQERQNSN